jgi:hypothetical protein
MAAGDLFIGGVMTAPTFGANDEGALYLSATNGLTLQGQGSTNDVTLLNKGGGVGCALLTGVPTFLCGTVQANTSSGFSHSTATNGAATDAFRNTSSNSAASLAVNIGNNTSATEVTMTLNSSANVGGNGVNSFTINSAAGLWLQGGGISVGAPTGGNEGVGTVNAAAPFYANGVKGVTCSGALTVIASITIADGIITAATGTGGTCS